MEITLEHCRWFDHLLRWHTKWNQGQSWLWGSPRTFVARYWLPDHHTWVDRELFETVAPDGTKLKGNRLIVNHPQLLLDSSWSMSELSNLRGVRYWIHHSQPLVSEISHVGDADQFHQLLTEWLLLNSLTEQPLVL